MNLAKTILSIVLLLTGDIAVEATPRQSKIIPSAKFDKIEVGAGICVSYTKGEYADVKIEYPTSLSEKDISAYIDASTRTLVVKKKGIKTLQGNNIRNINNDDNTIYVTCSSPELKHLELGFSSRFNSDSPILSSSSMKISARSSSKITVPGISATELNLSAEFSSEHTLGNISVEKLLTMEVRSSSTVSANNISLTSGPINIDSEFSSTVKVGTLSTPDICRLNIGSSSKLAFGSISVGELYLNTEFSSEVTLCNKTSEANIKGDFVANLSSSASLMLPGKLSAGRIDMKTDFGSNARINEIGATESFDLELGGSSTFTAASVSATTLQITPAFSSGCRIFSCKVNKLYSRSTSNCNIEIRDLKANIVDIKNSNGSITLSGEAASTSIITSGTSSQVNVDNLKIRHD